MILACVVACASVAACGKKAPPLPPLVKLPVAPTEFTAARRGATVDLQFGIPTANIDGVTPGDVARVDVYGMTGPSTLTPDEIIRHGAKVGTVAVNPAADPDATEEEAARVARSAPPGGKDQGTVVRFSDPLQLAVAVDEADVRSYLAVAFNRRGRRGAVSPKLMVPLVLSPPAPDRPDVVWDEREIVVSWPLNAQDDGVPFTYHVYAPGEIDVRLTKDPVETGRFVDTRLEWGAERCYVVRAVAIAQALPLESEASPRACVTLEDSFAPARPGNVNVIAGAGAMNLIWDSGAEPDVVGYFVFRALGSEAQLAPITAMPVDRATYQDVVAPGTRVTYAVQAVDRAGNVSPLSEPVVEVAR